jgi:hypothetical protein
MTALFFCALLSKEDGINDCGDPASLEVYLSKSVGAKKLSFLRVFTVWAHLRFQSGVSVLAFIL